MEARRKRMDLVGVYTTALITAMDWPLGRYVAHTLEVIESIETLKPLDPEDEKKLRDEVRAEAHEDLIDYERMLAGVNILANAV